MDRLLGSLVEAQGRLGAEKLFGPGYGKSLMAQSICDLSHLIPDNVVGTGGPEGAELPKRLAMVSMVAASLVKDDIPEKLLRCIAAKLEVSSVRKTGQGVLASIVDGFSSRSGGCIEEGDAS